MDPERPVGPGRAPSTPQRSGGSAGSSRLDRLVLALRVDLAPRHRQPAWGLVVLATVVSLVGSLGLDEAAVHLGTTVFPTTVHFSHFRFSDYASLTIVGVLAACAGWPAVTRVSSAPRWLFVRLAMAVTLVLWLPDVWLLAQGESPKAVAVLMVMHLLIAVVTYNALVRIASVAPSSLAAAVPSSPQRMDERAVRRIWNAMAALVALELALGVVAIVSVPFRRPDAILPARSTWLYAAHGSIGIALGLGAVGVLVLSLLSGRMARIGAVLGAVGVGVGLIGGVLATFQVTRLVGMGVMLVGVVLAGVGYLVPTLDAMGRAEAAKAAAARAELARAREDAAHAARTLQSNGAGGHARTDGSPGPGPAGR